MRQIGQRKLEEQPGLHPAAVHLHRLGQHLQTLSAFSGDSGAIPIVQGVYRQSHAQANAQMDEALAVLMARCAAARQHG